MSDFPPYPALNSGQLLIGNSSNIAQARALSGDVTVTNAGVTAIGSGKVTSAMIVDGTIVDGDHAANTLSAALPNFGTYFSTPMVGATASGASGFTNILYWAALQVLSKTTLTGIGYWVGGTANGNVRVALYDSPGTTRVANCTTSTAQGSINTFQKVAFDSTYQAPAGWYFAALLYSSSTGTAYVGKGMSLGSAATQGGFTTPTTVTVPSTPAATSPILTTY